MSHPARYWIPQEDSQRIICQVCPRECTLSDGQRGFCYTRANEGGRLILSGYGRLIGLCGDPIEKKPLNHFLPGTGVLSFGTAGCNLGCKFCQNWDMSKARDLDRASRYVSPEQLPQLAREHHCRSVAFTYNDPTIFIEYAIDVANACHEEDIRTVAVTAGYIQGKAREELYAHMDAANIDLKGFSESFYQHNCLATLEPVLDTLKYVKHETDTWLEVTTLIIPDENDSEAELQEQAEWLMENLGPDTPIHFTAFHPDYKMIDKSHTPAASLRKAYDIARRCGLQYVYVGNIHDATRSSTYCHHCGELLISRDWYQMGTFNLDVDRCRFCDTPVSGVFLETGLGDYGAERHPLRMREEKW